MYIILFNDLIYVYCFCCYDVFIDVNDSTMNGYMYCCFNNDVFMDVEHSTIYLCTYCFCINDVFTETFHSTINEKACIAVV